MENNKYDVSIFIMMDSGEVVYSLDYNRDDNNIPRFIMLTNDILKPEYKDDNTIFISCKWYDDLEISDYVKEVKCLTDRARQHFDSDYAYAREIERDFPDVRDYDYYEPHCYRTIGLQNNDKIIDIELMWQVENKNLTNNYLFEWYESDLNGYKNTKQIIERSKPLTREYIQKERYDEIDYIKGAYFDVENIECYIPVFMAAYHTTEIFQNQIIHGFLPAIGQLEYISNNIFDINNVLKQCNEDAAEFPMIKKVNGTHVLDSYWWSSTEYNEKSAFALSEGRNCTRDKDSTNFHLTLFPIKL